nr:hypothetical protein [Tanacetum cinerariifolium]
MVFDDVWGVRIGADTFLKVILAFLRKLWASLKVPINLDDKNAVLLQLFDLSVHNFHGFFNEITCMAFEGNIRDLGSFGEETDKITDLHQIRKTEYGDNVAGIKRCRRDLSSDDVKDLATASGRG